MKTPTKEKAKAAKRACAAAWGGWSQRKRLLAINLFGLASGHAPSGTLRTPSTHEVHQFTSFINECQSSCLTPVAYLKLTGALEETAT